MPRRLAALLLPLAAVAVFALGAAAATTASRPAGAPDLAAMALALSDLPAGAKIASQGYAETEAIAEYKRLFVLRAARVGKSRLDGLFHELFVDANSSEAASEFAALEQLLSTKSGRDQLKKAFASGLASSPLKSATVTIGKPRRAAIGDGAISILVRLTGKNKATLDIVITFVRLDRVIGVLGFYSTVRGHVAAADVDRITRVSVGRMKNGLIPVSLAPPTVGGALLPGQTAAALAGTWGGDLVAFAYQWQRCDAAGAGCVDIAGATSSSYPVTTGDLASTLRVSVTGSNALGSVIAVSVPTAVVAGPPGSPVVTAGPTIAGAPQQSGTLTVSTGEWSGAPTGFAYQWRRCDAAGTTCVDIVGAIGASYVLTAADAGKTIRVLVVATNAAGPGGAITAQTAAVPS